MPIDSRVDIRDPLGAPESVDPSRYMDALARLGFNVDNMSSYLPQAVANMKNVNELFTYNWNQQMGWQKTQAEARYNMAQADHLDEETDFNTKTSDLRIQALDTEQKQRELALALGKNKLTVDNATIEAQIQQAKDKAAQEHDVATQAGLLTKQEQERAEQRHNALDNIDATIAAVRAIPQDAPDWDAQFAKVMGDPNYMLAATNEATRDRFKQTVDNIRQARQSSSVLQTFQARKVALQDALSKELLPGAYANRQDAIAQNDDQFHDAMARAHLSETNQQITNILRMLQGTDVTRTPMLNTYISNLENAQKRINAMLQDDDTASHLATGKHSDYFTADGRLYPEMQSELNAIEALAKAGGKSDVEKVTIEGQKDLKDPFGKADTYTIDIPRDAPQAEKQRRIDAARESLKSPETRAAEAEAKAKNDALQKVADAAGTKPAAGDYFNVWNPFTWTKPHAPAADPEVNAMADRVRTLVANNPAMATYMEQMKTGTPEQQARAKAIIRDALFGAAPEGHQYGGIAGTRPGLMRQEGGSVFQPSSLEQFPQAPPPGSTDTVPAMLTPGEFVVNKAAAQENMPLLEAINAQGNTQTGAHVSSQADIKQSSVQPTITLAGKQRTLGTVPGSDQQQPAGATTGQPGAAKPTPWYGTGTFYGKQPTDSETKTPTPADNTGTSGADVAAAVVTNTGARTPGQVETSSPIGGGSFANIGKTIDGAQITQYGYPGDASWDVNSGKGLGDRENKLQPGFSVALTQSQRKLLFPDAPVNKKTGLTYSTGKTFTWGGQTYRDDDSTSGDLTDNRIDVYNPHYSGIDKGVTAQMVQNRLTVMGYQMGGPVFQDNPKGGWLAPGPTGMQHGGEVAEEGSIGTGGGKEPELDQSVQPSMRHRRMHPRVGAPGELGGIGPDIPDPMQKKLAKLSQGYLSGLSDIIRSRPEMGPALLKHARHQLAANMGGQPEDWMMEGQQPGAKQYAQAAPSVPPEAYSGGGMEAYMQTGGMVPTGSSSVPINSIYPVMSIDANMTELMPSNTNMVPSGSLYPILPAGGMPASVMPATGNLPQLDPIGFSPIAGQMDPTVDPSSFFTGTGYQKGGKVKAKKGQRPKSTLKLDDYSLAELTHAHNLLTNMLARRNS